MISSSTRYIYLLTDPRTSKPFYVGMTQNPKVRLRTHIYNSTLNKASHTSTEAYIVEMINAGYTPFLTIIDEIQTDDFNKYHALERSWMLKMVELGHKLTNTRTEQIEQRCSPSFHIVGIDDNGDFIITPNN